MKGDRVAVEKPFPQYRITRNLRHGGHK